MNYLKVQPSLNLQLNYKYYMNQEEFKEFMSAQTDAIEVAKWLLGEKLGRDPGQEARGGHPIPR